MEAGSSGSASAAREQQRPAGSICAADVSAAGALSAACIDDPSGSDCEAPPDSAASHRAVGEETDEWATPAASSLTLQAAALSGRVSDGEAHEASSAVNRSCSPSSRHSSAGGSIGITAGPAAAGRGAAEASAYFEARSQGEIEEAEDGGLDGSSAGSSRPDGASCSQADDCGGAASSAAGGSVSGEGEDEDSGVSSEDEYAASEWPADDQEDGRRALHGSRGRQGACPDSPRGRTGIRESLRCFFKGLGRRKGGGTR